MCGTRLKAFLLGCLALVVLCFQCYSEKKYYITETQLVELEQIQQDQAKRIENLSNLSKDLQQQITDLEKSYTKSEKINQFLKIALPIASAVCLGTGIYLGYTLTDKSN